MADAPRGTLPLQLLDPRLLVTAHTQAVPPAHAGSLLLAELVPGIPQQVRRAADGNYPEFARTLVHIVEPTPGNCYEVEVTAPAHIGRPLAASYDILIALEGLVHEGRVDMETGEVTGAPISQRELLERSGWHTGGSSHALLHEHLRRLTHTVVTVTSRAALEKFERARARGRAERNERIKLDGVHRILRVGRDVILDVDAPPTVLHNLSIDPIWLAGMKAGLLYWFNGTLHQQLHSGVAKRLLQYIGTLVAREQLDDMGPWVIDDLMLMRNLGLLHSPGARSTARELLDAGLEELQARGALRDWKVLEAAARGRGATRGRLLELRVGRNALAARWLSDVTLEEQHDHEWMICYANMRQIGLEPVDARHILHTHPRHRVRQAILRMWYYDDQKDPATISWSARLRFVLKHPSMLMDRGFQDFCARLRQAEFAPHANYLVEGFDHPPVPLLQAGVHEPEQKPDAPVHPVIALIGDLQLPESFLGAVTSAPVVITDDAVVLTLTPFNHEWITRKYPAAVDAFTEALAPRKVVWSTTDPGDRR